MSTGLVSVCSSFTTPPDSSARAHQTSLDEEISSVAGHTLFPQASMQTAFTEYLHTLNEIEQRIGRLEHALMEEAATHPKAEMIRILQSLRGIGFLTAVSLVSEIGSFARFSSPAKLMAYLGLVPREHSSGASTKRGSLTKTGNGRLRRTLIESSWSYRHRPVVKGDLACRLEGLPADVQDISWRAQVRLHNKFRRLIYKNTSTPMWRLPP